MNQDYQHWSVDPYSKSFENYSYSLKNIYPCHYINMLESEPQLSPGFISINVISQADKKPIAGAKIVGPQYSFSTYDLRVDAFGYFSSNVFNIRLFPNITTYFDIVMTPVTQIEPNTFIEKRIDIPPNPMDVTK